MRRATRLSWTLTAFVITTASPALAEHETGTATAPSPRVTLAWEAPTGCPSRDEAQAMLARLLAGSTTTDTLDAEVKITPYRGGAFRARLRTHLRGVRGERSLSAESCALAASAATLVLALTLDPTLPLEPPRDEAPPTPPPEPATPSPAALVEAPPAPELPTPPITVTPAALAVLGTGQLPSWAVGVEAQLAVARGWASLVAGAGAFVPQDATAASSADKGGRFTLLEASLRACAGVGLSPGVRGDACAGVELDQLRGEGRGVSSPDRGAARWLAPRVGVQLAWRPASFLTIPIAADLLAPLDRPTFTLDNVGAVFRPAPLAFRTAIGFALHFD